MLVINKLALEKLNYVNLLTALQTGTSAVLIICAWSLGFTDLTTHSVANIKVYWGWRGAVIVWLGPLLLNLQAMKYLTVEAVMMFRSISVIIVALGDLFIFKTSLTLLQIFACLVITTGGFVYASYDLHFHFEGYLWGFSYTIGMVLNSLYLKYLFNQYSEFIVWTKTFINNFMSFVILVIYIGYTDSIANIFGIFSEMSMLGLCYVCISCFMGLCISMSGTQCRTSLSATAFDVLGNSTKYLTLIINMQVSKNKHSFVSIMGICIALFGTILYSPVGENMKCALKIFFANQCLNH